MDDTRTLKRKVDSIITNIEIYRRDIDKEMKKLKSLGIDDPNNADEIYDKIKQEIKELDIKKDKVLQKAQNLLKDISDD